MLEVIALIIFVILFFSEIYTIIRFNKHNWEDGNRSIAADAARCAKGFKSQTSL